MQGFQDAVLVVNSLNGHCKSAGGSYIKVCIHLCHIASGAETT